MSALSLAALCSAFREQLTAIQLKHKWLEVIMLIIVITKAEHVDLAVRHYNTQHTTDKGTESTKVRRQKQRVP
jgi:hypothetical protein